MKLKTKKLQSNCWQTRARSTGVSNCVGNPAAADCCCLGFAWLPVASFSADQHEEQGCDEEQDPEELTQAKLPSSAMICKVHGFPDVSCDFYARGIFFQNEPSQGKRGFFVGFRKCSISSDDDEDRVTAKKAMLEDFVFWNKVEVGEVVRGRRLLWPPLGICPPVPPPPPKMHM